MPSEILQIYAMWWRGKEEERETKTKLLKLQFEFSNSKNLANPIAKATGNNGLFTIWKTTLAIML